MAKRSASSSPQRLRTEDIPPLPLTSPAHIDGESEIAMTCSLPPHPPCNFFSVAEHERHYFQQHIHRCLDCQKNFPSTHYLELHIRENHDPFVAIQREKGEKTYACFVEGCDKVCADWKKRKQHCIDKHSFHKFYDFLVVNDGIDNRTTMLRPERFWNTNTAKRPQSKEIEMGDAGGSSERVERDGGGSRAENAVRASALEHAMASRISAGTTAENTADEDMDDASEDASVPQSVRFGRGHGKMFRPRFK
ncbi:hypothetical protein BDY21DRAFT_330272 [Lineolata rhizophorae]|uniref:C2H2-type domain-containing protein n=1 Tax=Lineolata rhizophorae TaxID=578093 RepID=A0A6A6PDF3_9PEZI|nr:hypothetical protein BDY21DRAFT_330272 [Lineolata rhizophorae]